MIWSMPFFTPRSTWKEREVKGLPEYLRSDVGLPARAEGEKDEEKGDE